MPSVVEEDIRKEDEAIEASEKLGDALAREVELSQKIVPTPRPEPPFPQRLVKRTEDGKYRRFFTILKQLHQCPIDRIFGTNALLC